MGSQTGSGFRKPDPTSRSGIANLVSIHETYLDSESEATTGMDWISIFNES